MSAFVVEDKTINAVVTEIYHDRDNLYLVGKGLCLMDGIEKPTTAAIYDKAREMNEEMADRLGRALLMMNIEAVNQRYDENNDGTEALTEYRFVHKSCSRIQALKALQCLVYQCSEGDVPERPLYKWLNELSHSWALSIVARLPQYEKAFWG